MVVTALKVVHKYNETMDGVDLGDQLLLKFEPQFKSIKLIRKVFFNLLTTATGILVNAHFWYRNSFLVQTKMDHVRFQHSIIKGLIGPTGMGFPQSHETEHRQSYDRTLHHHSLI